MLFSFLLLLSCRCTEPSSPFLLPLKHQHHHHHQSPLITASAPIVRRQTHTLNSVTQPPPRALANSIYRRTVGIQNIYFCNPPPLTQRPSKRGIIIKLWGRCHCLPVVSCLPAMEPNSSQRVSWTNKAEAVERQRWSVSFTFIGIGSRSGILKVPSTFTFIHCAIHRNSATKFFLFFAKYKTVTFGRIIACHRDLFANN